MYYNVISHVAQYLQLNVSYSHVVMLVVQGKLGLPLTEAA